MAPDSRSLQTNVGWEHLREFFVDESAFNHHESSRNVIALHSLIFFVRVYVRRYCILFHFIFFHFYSVAAELFVAVLGSSLAGFFALLG